MKVNEVTIKQMVDIANKNWGYKEGQIRDSNIATILDILIGHGHSLVETGNISNLPCLVIWSPFCNWYTDNKPKSKNKIIGFYTLTKQEWKKLINSRYIEENENRPYNLFKICKIARKLYDD